jgi:hypothetical protein
MTATCHRGGGLASFERRVTERRDWSTWLTGTDFITAAGPLSAYANQGRAAIRGPILVNQMVYDMPLWVQLLPNGHIVEPAGLAKFPNIRRKMPNIGYSRLGKHFPFYAEKCRVW